VLQVMIIIENDEIILSTDNGRVFMTIKKERYNLKKVDELTRNHPRLKILDFMAVKKAVESGSHEPIELGAWIDSMELEISSDKMQAFLTIYESPKFIQDNLENLQMNIHKLLQDNRIIFGQRSLDLMSIKTGKSYIIAEGLPPEKGANAKITYLQQAEKTPVINDDGKADYFDMNFLVEISEGSWLGEKIPAQQGVPGKNIFGEIVPPIMGDDSLLKYDTKSAYEVEEEGKTVLRSKTKGVIGELNGVLTVQKHLVIDGDVGLETGNLKFDGSIQVRGTVMAGYSIIASGDISIDSNEGVHAAELIKSTEGDVFIKGGIFGKGITTIEAHQNIFVKHANECTLEAKDTIQIGSYSLGATIFCDKLVVDERKGKIIGGKAIAINSISTAYSGNNSERKTELIVQGIDRKILTENAKTKAQEMMKLQEETTKLNFSLSQLNQFKSSMSVQQVALYEQTKQKYNETKRKVKELDEEIQRILKMLRQTSDYFIDIKREANPGTVIQIGNKSSYLTKQTKGKFKLENGELNV